MSTGSKQRGKKVQSSHQKTNGNHDIMQSLLSTSMFDEPPKKKVDVMGPSSKDLEIDENDSSDEIFRKLVLNIKALRTELNEYKHYTEGTFCTQVVHNRNFDTLEKKIEDLTSTVEDLV